MEKNLTGASEASELIYFGVYKSQVPVLEHALEIAAGCRGRQFTRILPGNDLCVPLTALDGRPPHCAGRFT